MGNEFLISGSYNSSIKIWEVLTGKILDNFEFFKLDILKSLCSPDWKYLVTKISDRRINVWEISTGILIKTFEDDFGFNNLQTISTNGKYLLLSSFNKLYLLEVGAWSYIKKLNEHSDTINSCVFSSDSKLIASSSYDKTVKIWDVSSGKLFRNLEGHTAPVTFCIFSPDNKLIVSTSYDRTIKIWEVSSGILLKNITEIDNNISSLIYSSDGKYIIIGDIKGVIKIFDICYEKVKTIKSHFKEITSLNSISDGNFLITGSYDKTIKIWEISTGKLIKTLGDYYCMISSISFSPDKKYISITHENAVSFCSYKQEKDKFDITNHVTFYNLPDNNWFTVMEENKNFVCSEGAKEYFYFNDNLAIYPISDFPELEKKEGLDIFKDSKSGKIIKKKK